MTEEEQEDLADRYYQADAWFAKQGELSGWLWTEDRAPEASRITIAALEASQTWPEVLRNNLVQTFFTAKYIKEKSLGWRRESVVTPYL
jgi:hypothetical protein